MPVDEIREEYNKHLDFGGCGDNVIDYIEWLEQQLLEARERIENQNETIKSLKYITEGASNAKLS